MSTVITLYLLWVTLGFTAWILLLRFLQLLPICILFYRGIAAGLIALMLQSALYFLLHQSPNCEQLVSIVTMTGGIILTFFIVIPVTIERSVSVYLLGKMYERGGAEYSVEDLNNLLKSEYVDRFDAAAWRMREQMASGNVRRVGAKYTLTRRGVLFIGFCRVVASILHLEVSWKRIQS